MGMYTEFIFGCELSKDTPRICIEALDYTINGEDKKPKYENPVEYAEKRYNESYIDITLPLEEIEEFMDRYDFGRLFHCSSYYFGANNPTYSFRYDSISDSYHISTRADLKNYEDQIDNFIDYIRPYVISGSGPLNVFAYSQYEEDEFPILYCIDYQEPIYFTDKEFMDKLNKKEDMRWHVLGKMFELLAPEYCVTKEECTRHGKEPGKESYDDVWVWMVEYIIGKYAKYNDGNRININLEYDLIDEMKGELTDKIKQISQKISK